MDGSRGHTREPASLDDVERHGAVVDYLGRVGGTSAFGPLAAATSRAAVRSALSVGIVARDARGRYALPDADAALRAANRHTAVVSHLSAAVHWGLAVKDRPACPHITVPRHRRIGPGRTQGAHIHYRDLLPFEVIGGRVTTPLRTVVDCSVTLSFDAALAVADSALRDRLVQIDELRLACNRVARGRIAAVRVAWEADGRAANPFESALRAISLDVAGLRLRPQLTIADDGLRCPPDLVDQCLGIVVEADSFEFHGRRRDLERDCRRYDELAVRGWLVLRFAWDHVMFHPDWVRDVLVAAVARRSGRRTASRTRWGCPD